MEQNHSLSDSYSDPLMLPKSLHGHKKRKRSLWSHLFGKKVSYSLDAEREAYVKAQDHHMELHRRLDAELRERHEHLRRKAEQLEKMHAELDEKHQEVDETRAQLKSKTVHFSKLKQYQDSLENKEINLASDKKKLEHLRLALKKKEEELATKEQALRVAAQHSQQLEAEVEIEDDAILYLQRRLGERNAAAQKQHAQVQLDRNDPHEDIHRVINECRLLLSIEDIAGARRHYVAAKSAFEELPAFDPALYDDILKLYNEVRDKQDGA